MSNTGNGGERRQHMQWTPSDVINLVAVTGLLIIAAGGMAGVAVVYWHRGLTPSELVLITNGICTGILGFIGGRALAQMGRPMTGASQAVVTGGADTVNVNTDPPPIPSIVGDATNVNINPPAVVPVAETGDGA